MLYIPQLFEAFGLTLLTLASPDRVSFSSNGQAVMTVAKLWLKQLI